MAMLFCLRVANKQFEPDRPHAFAEVLLLEEPWKIYKERKKIFG